MKKWTGLFIMALPAMPACSGDVAITESGPDELGDVVVGDITVPYGFVKAAADAMNQPVSRIWHLMYRGFLEDNREPLEAPAGQTDLRNGLTLLNQAGIEIPIDLTEAGVAADDDDDHQCTLRLYDGDWDDEDAVANRREHHLNPWGACVDGIIDQGECSSIEEFETSRSEDDKGNKYFHAWCPEA